MSFKRAGYRRLPRTSMARFSGAGVRRFCRFFTPGTRQQRRIRIVDSCGDTFSDGGANPPASTIRLANEVSEANGVLSESVGSREALADGESKDRQCR